MNPLDIIQRYDWDEHSGMVPVTDGDYVKYEDVAQFFIRTVNERIDEAYQRGWEDGLNED